VNKIEQRLHAAMLNIILDEVNSSLDDAQAMEAIETTQKYLSNAATGLQLTKRACRTKAEFLQLMEYEGNVK
jgi:hypothetical protein